VLKTAVFSGSRNGHSDCAGILEALRFEDNPINLLPIVSRQRRRVKALARGGAAR